MRHVIIVNGKPLVGKTSFAKFAKEWYKDTISPSVENVHIKSAVEKMYEVYRLLGWNGKKTLRFRQDMSNIKAMYINNCDGPTKDIVEYVLRLKTADDHIIFYDCREPDEIYKTVSIFNALRLLDITVTTLMITRPEVEEQSKDKRYGNSSDDGVNNYRYDHTIDNNSTEQDFKIKVYEFCDTLFGRNK